MLKKTETEKTIVFFVTFLSLVALQLGGPGPPGPPSGYAYALNKGVISRKFKKTVSNDCATVNLHAVEKAR